MVKCILQLWCCRFDTEKQCRKHYVFIKVALLPLALKCHRWSQKPHVRCGPQRPDLHLAEPLYCRENTAVNTFLSAWAYENTQDHAKVSKAQDGTWPLTSACAPASLSVYGSQETAFHSTPALCSLWLCGVGYSQCARLSSPRPPLAGRSADRTSVPEHTSQNVKDENQSLARLYCSRVIKRGNIRMKLIADR